MGASMLFSIHKGIITRKRDKFFRVAAFITMMSIAAACSSLSKNSYQQWAAHGYLTPGPTSEPELIGVFDDLGECKAAADGWASRQVVGNPVFAECYPVDQD